MGGVEPAGQADAAGDAAGEQDQSEYDDESQEREGERGDLHKAAFCRVARRFLPARFSSLNRNESVAHAGRQNVEFLLQRLQTRAQQAALLGRQIERLGAERADHAVKTRKVHLPFGVEQASGDAQGCGDAVGQRLDRVHRRQRIEPGQQAQAGNFWFWSGAIHADLPSAGGLPKSYHRLAAMLPRRGPAPGRLPGGRRTVASGINRFFLHGAQGAGGRQNLPAWMRSFDMDLATIPLFALADRRLAWADARQGLLAQNVANADTPGFRGHEAAAFDAHLSAVDGSAGFLDRTNPLHLAAPAAANGVQANGGLRSVNGNAVSLDAELAKIAETETAHDLVADLYKKYLGFFKTAIGR